MIAVCVLSKPTVLYDHVPSYSRKN